MEVLTPDLGSWCAMRTRLLESWVWIFRIYKDRQTEAHYGIQFLLISPSSVVCMLGLANTDCCSWFAWTVCCVCVAVTPCLVFKTMYVMMFDPHRERVNPICVCTRRPVQQLTAWIRVLLRRRDSSCLSKHGFSWVWGACICCCKPVVVRMIVVRHVGVMKACVLGFCSKVVRSRNRSLVRVCRG